MGYLEDYAARPAIIVSPRVLVEPFPVTNEQAEVAKAVATAHGLWVADVAQSGEQHFLPNETEIEVPEGTRYVSLRGRHGVIKPKTTLFWNSLNVTLRERGDTAMVKARDLSWRAGNHKGAGVVSTAAAAISEFSFQNLTGAIAAGLVAAYGYLKALNLNNSSRHAERQALGLNPQLSPIHRSRQSLKLRHQPR